MDSLGCKEPWKEYLRREVEWAREALSRFSTDDDVPQRYIDLFRERQIRVTSALPGRDRAESLKTKGDKSQQKWSYDVLKEILAEVRTCSLRQNVDSYVA